MRLTKHWGYHERKREKQEAGAWDWNEGVSKVGGGVMLEGRWRWGSRSEVIVTETRREELDFFF